MRKCIYILILNQIIFSCGYPDVDSVPDFENDKLSEDELMELCSSKTSDNNILCKNNN